MGFAHGCGLQKYQLRRVSYIFSRAKPTLRQPIADTRKSSEKTPHIPASYTVIPAQAGIQTFDFQKYSTITAAWDLPHGCSLQKYWSRQGVYVLLAKPAIFSDDVLVKLNV